MMAYDINAGNNTLHPRTFYALYIGSNDNGVGHLIFILSTKQILTTLKYKPVHMHEDLIKKTNKQDSLLEFKQQHTRIPMNTQRIKRIGYLIEFCLSNTLAVIWISRAVAGSMNWMWFKSL